MHISFGVTYMYTNFGGSDFSSFGDIATFKKWLIFPFDQWAIDPWSSKNSIA